MSNTLHDETPPPYYGRWPRKKAAVPEPQSPSIAHNERAAGAGFVAFDGRSKIFPVNRSPPRWKFASTKEKNLRLTKWRAATAALAASI